MPICGCGMWIIFSEQIPISMAISPIMQITDSNNTQKTKQKPDDLHRYFKQYNFLLTRKKLVKKKKR